MGNCLNLTLVKKKCSFDQCLAISGRAGKSNLCVFRKKLIDFLDGADGGFEWVSVVVAVERIEKGSVLTDQCSLGSGGTCIDSQKTFSLICRKIAGFYLVSTLAFVESLIVSSVANSGSIRSTSKSSLMVVACVLSARSGIQSHPASHSVQNRWLRTDGSYPVR